MTHQQQVATALQADAGRGWQSERPVPLLPHVLRLTAPNPGFMTGPGTNSYLVGSPRCGYVVIDPGPNDLGHVERLWQATQGAVQLMVCTHSHPDHAPGAWRLQALCRERGLPPPPIAGLPSAPTAHPHSHFVPDRTLTDGERLLLPGPDGLPIHTLRVVHTPGHAANHVCLVLEQDGLLFSGDHILNGSTTVIDPPDGHMGDYLDSLDRLDRLCAEHHVQCILPAHGHVLQSARAAIAHLKAHRLAREAKVLAAMQTLPEGTPADWVRLAYSDVPPALWPVAQRSLLAHVEHLRALANPPT